MNVDKVKWINSFCYQVMMVQGFRDEVALSGIELEPVLTLNLEGAKLLKKFLTVETGKSFKEVVIELWPEITQLAKKYDDSLIPFDREQIKIIHTQVMTSLIATQALQDLKFNEFKTEDVENIVDKLNSIQSRDKKAESFTSIVSEELYNHLNNAREGKSLKIVKGFEYLSKMIGGFNEGRIGIALGQTGFGKTNLLLNLAMRAAAEMKVLFINMEMSMADIARRSVVSVSGVSFDDYNNNPHKLENGFTKILNELQKLNGNLFITNGYPLTLAEIKANARSILKKGDLDLIIIDYDQKLDLPVSSHEPEWKVMQKAIIDLESFARKFNTHIILAAQTNSDGRISSSNRATFPAHYVIKFHDHKKKGPLVEAIKNRHGVTGAAVGVNYNKKFAQITESEVFKPDELNADKFESNDYLTKRAQL